MLFDRLTKFFHDPCYLVQLILFHFKRDFAFFYLYSILIGKILFCETRSKRSVEVYKGKQGPSLPALPPHTDRDTRIMNPS